jgi:hypothetical protein
MDKIGLHRTSREHRRLGPISGLDAYKNERLPDGSLYSPVKRLAPDAQECERDPHLLPPVLVPFSTSSPSGERFPYMKFIWSRGDPETKFQDVAVESRFRLRASLDSGSPSPVSVAAKSRLDRPGRRGSIFCVPLPAPIVPDACRARRRLSDRDLIPPILGIGRA